MSEVDDRIVEMKFDNALFERKLGDTIKSLDKLRASLDMAGSTKGLEKVADATKHFSFAGIHNGLDEVSRGFLAMSTIAITALAQVTSAALSAGGHIAKAFTLSPIIDGFSEMETNMNSIQTILANTASKGTTLDQVNEALQLLNEYSDKTIYNFGQMARNIGTFTAAGIDLDTSVDAIKGIANLAAVSGSSAEQASSAMYQLSQALATGTLKLIDWNSVVNAGMGGEVFKNALFETGKALGKLGDIPMDTTFKEWEKANGSFRESLQDGWITSDVLTTALGTFTGDLTDAQLRAKGFTDEQIVNLQAMGKTATAAATEVKTFTQLMGTVKEAIGTGWADTFKLLIGDFGEAKSFFTGVNNFIGGIVQQSADARNKVLSEWKFMGGRNVLIQGFWDSLVSIGTIIEPIKKAFRDIFPAMTGKRLFDITQRFGELAKNFAIGAETADKLRSIFRGFFAVLEIGWTVVKEGIGFIGDILRELSGAGEAVFGFAATSGDTLTELNEALVKGGGIKKFFEQLLEVIKRPIDFLKDLSEAIHDFFVELRGGEGVGDVISDTTGRFEHLKAGIEKIGEVWAWFAEKTEGVRQALGDLWNYITQWFRELGNHMKSEMNAGDFEGALDIFNVAFLGGIILLLRKFFKNGLNIDFGGGIMQKISGMFSELTGVLKAMQIELKAQALLKIAIALGILTLSIIALSLIDSAALTKALVAISAGFANLVAAMALMDKTVVSSPKIAILAAGMVLMAGAMLILSAAIKVLSTMSWDELAKGLVGIAGGMTVMVTALNFMGGNTAGLIRAGVSIIAIAIGLRILANAMQAFATMGWEEIAKGLISVAGGLLVLVTAMNRVPPENMIQAGLGIIAISVGLRILANAMQAFATMSWEEIAKGLVAVAAGLGIIVLLTNTMPAGGLIGIGVGLIAVGIALNIVAQAIESLGKMDLGVMIQGLAGLGAMLLMLALATNAMNHALPGAAAMIVVSGAMLIMANVLEKIGNLGVEKLIIGLAGLAGILVVLGVGAYLLAPVIPTLLALGAAIALIGGAFALFGAGAYLTIKAFDLLGKTGKKSMQALIEIIAIFVARAPLIGIAIARVLVEAVTEFLNAGPTLVKALKVLLLELLDAIIELAPKIGEAVIAITDMILEVMRKEIPHFIEVGLELLLAFLTGLNENIREIVDVGSEIIINFLNGLTKNIDSITEAGVNLIINFLAAITDRMGDIVEAGLTLVVEFVRGIAENIGMVISAATDLIIQFAYGIASNIMRVVEAGANIVIYLMQGIAGQIFRIAEAAVGIVVEFIDRLGDNALLIVDAGFQLLINLLLGIGNNLIEVANTVGQVVSEFITALGNNALLIINAGFEALKDFLWGIEKNLSEVITVARKVVVKFLESLSSNTIAFAEGALDVLLTFLHHLEKVIREKTPEIQKAVGGVADAIIDGIKDGLKAGAGSIVGSVTGLGESMIRGLRDTIDARSPSREFMKLAGYAIQGLTLVFDRDTTAQKSAVGVANRMTENMQAAFNKMPSYVPVIGDVNPVITPVLDLTKVRAASKDIDKLMSDTKITADASIAQARTLSLVTNVQNGIDSETEQPAVRDVSFNQTINAPTQLSVNDIYRSTKSQLAIAKEELGIA